MADREILIHGTSTVACVVPFAAYLVLTQFVSSFPGHYAWAYPVAAVLTAGITGVLLRNNDLVRPHWNVTAGIAAGVIGIALWIALCGLDLEQRLTVWLPSWLQPEARAGFDPFIELSHSTARWSFVAARLFGLAIVVPVVEEVFWRGFLMRWLIAEDWQSEPIGQFTPYSFAAVTVLFALAHPEWIAAAVWCAVINGLLYWTRDLWNCVVAHAVTNLLLGVYVLASGTWDLW